MTVDVQPGIEPVRPGRTDYFLREVRAMHKARADMVELSRHPGAAERFLIACGDSFDPNEWTFRARLDQLLPPDLDWCHLWLAGRGWGKTRALSGCVHAAVRSGGIRQIHLVAPTHKAVIETNIEGHSGIIATCGRHDERPRWVAQRQRLEWPNGARLSCFSAATEALDQLRGPSCELLLIDELAAMPKAQQVFDLAWQACRLGTKPRVIIATTPRPIALLKKLIAMEGVSVARGSTFDNADNLPPEWLEQLRKEYEGTQQGRQELGGELILRPHEGMFFDEWLIHQDVPPGLIEQVTVGVDPAYSEVGDQCGIVVVARLRDERFAVLADRTVAGSMAALGDEVIRAHDDFGAEDIVVEKNGVGASIAEVTKQAARRQHAEGKRGEERIVVRTVEATQSKGARAAPISLLYEKRQVVHVSGLHALEAEMLDFDRTTNKSGGKSPNRMDALVHGLSRLSKIKTSCLIAIA